MRNLLTILLVGLITTSCSVEPKVPVSLNQLFTDHMVIQRNNDIHVFGKATPGISINANLADNSASAKVADNGSFDIVLPELTAGGPYELVISTDDTIITLIDILIGDVWVCSGQSNMEFKLKNSFKGKETIESSKSNLIRIVDVPNDLEFWPLDDFRNELQWLCADVDSIEDFTAVGYYFGAKLQSDLNIPIGLIGSNWGGTIAESWTQTQALDSLPNYKEVIDFVNGSKLSVKEFEVEGKRIFKEQSEQFVNGVGIDEEWFSPHFDASDWGAFTVPGFWEQQIEGMEDFDGVVWFRREFDAPKSFVGKEIEIWLSQIHDYDMTWLNGVKIGESYSPTDWRGYTAGDSVIKEKGNVLIVRVYNRRSKGGFAGMSAYFDCSPKGEKKLAITTSGEWSYKIAKAIKDTLNIPMSCSNIAPNDYPSTIYNTKIHPMIKFPIKGAIWYQGETNGNIAYMYQKAFPAMINNWRQQWGIGDFPFYFVQLANFGPEYDKLGDSNWGELREAQSMALSLPNTGMAAILDIGNPDDIHPRNKFDVGMRLAYNALHKTYGIKTVYSGPTFSKYSIADAKVTIEFTELGSGLVTNNGKAPREFIIAGADKVFYPAKAKIVDNTVVVSCKKVANPVTVRYAWKNSPEVNLFNVEGLPAVPFRIDDWQGVTYNNTEY